jgi:site-specific recombinase XerD
MIEDLQLKHYSPATQIAYVNAVCQLAGYYDKSPEEITEEELRAYFLYQARNYAPGTLRTYVAGIRFCFGTTLQRPWPSLGLLRAGKQSRLRVVLSPLEVRAILGQVKVPVYRACLSTIYAGGLRLSEGTHLQVQDVDSERMILRVVGKGNKQRQVPLSQSTLQLLRRWWQCHRSQPWLFPASWQPRSRQVEGPVAIANVQEAFHAALAQSGVNKAATVHSLRHSYATHLLEKGVSLRLIQEILGHASPRTTAIYTHLTTEVCAQILEPLQALTDGL